MFGLASVDWVILLSYFVVIVAIGVISTRLIKNREDFLMGGRRFGGGFGLLYSMPGQIAAAGVMIAECAIPATAQSSLVAEQISRLRPDTRRSRQETIWGVVINILVMLGMIISVIAMAK